MSETAMAFYKAGRFEDAEAAFAEATAANPRDAAAWSGLAHAAAARLEHGRAIEAFRRAVTLGADTPAIRANAARSLFALGEVSQAIRQNERALAGADAEVRAKVLTNAMIMAPADPAVDNAALLRARRRWARAEAASIRPLNARPARGAKLRIGYVGGFFGERNWMKMYAGVLNAHDRGRFEITLIADGAMPSPEAGYREHDDDRIWDVEDADNAELAGHIAKAGMDVLVDLNGTSHMARFALPLYRAAPVQVAWNGMYGTTGMDCIDALIGDAWTIPVEEEQFCSEPVRRVSSTYLPFQVFYPTPDVAPPPCLAAGHVTFGSLASAYKLTDPTIGTWAAVLRACPGSRLVLRNRAMGYGSNRDAVLARFAAQGIEAARLTLLGAAPHDEFLRTYDAIDIALDSFPYSGGTTTAEAVWQGVPVLTTMGDRWAARTSRSILMAAGFPDDVAADADALVARAVALAAAPALLAERRATQRRKVAASPACDPAALCRELEAIYEELAARA
ncbi:tetratricopeptide repeat protein [Falsiroseomonas sp. HW251]|uniref:O-linked N-acetylglucosamine transferase, SPINDLY family protein n=1 Tax=Falsiroseomonas sp. HW251 TaxID=3390998 RepID=UPI003D31CA64